MPGNPHTPHGGRQRALSAATPTCDSALLVLPSKVRVRTKCPACGKELTLRQDGRIRHHKNTEGNYCSASLTYGKPITPPVLKCHCGKKALYEVFINGGKGNDRCATHTMELVTELVTGKTKGGNGQIIITPLS